MSSNKSLSCEFPFITLGSIMAFVIISHSQRRSRITFFTVIPTKPHIAWNQGDFSPLLATQKQREHPLKVQLKAHHVNQHPLRAVEIAGQILCFGTSVYAWTSDPGNAALKLQGKSWENILRLWITYVLTNVTFGCSENIGSQLKLQRVDVFAQEVNRKLQRDQVKWMGQFLSQHQMWELCRVPWCCTQGSLPAASWSLTSKRHQHVKIHPLPMPTGVQSSIPLAADLLLMFGRGRWNRKGHIFVKPALEVFTQHQFTGETRSLPCPPHPAPPAPIYIDLSGAAAQVSFSQLSVQGSSALWAQIAFSKLYFPYFQVQIQIFGASQHTGSCMG